MAKQERDRKTNKPLQIALLIVLVMALGIGGYFLADALGADALFAQGMPSPSPSLTLLPSHTASRRPSPTPKPSIIHVKVMGAVNNPGEYTLPWGSICQQALDKAGGLTEDADVNAVKLGKVLKDNAVILVPRK